MTGALLYQPKQRWRVGLAFVAAALIHFAAVAIAGMHHETQVEATPGDNGGVPVYLTPEDSPAERSTPPEEVAASTPIPLPVEQPIVHDKMTTPSPVRRQIFKAIAPIAKVRPGIGSGTPGPSSVRAMALSGPRPAYPYEARRQKITGSGVAVMTVNPATGDVIDAVMQESTGSLVLDNAAVAAFRKWRFKAGTGPMVKSPITFTLTGAQY
jgi:TonB family protein